jgi:hypothetical protein
MNKTLKSLILYGCRNFGLLGGTALAADFIPAAGAGRRLLRGRFRRRDMVHDNGADFDDGWVDPR